MAKYTVRMRCGHEEVVDLYGKTADREKRISWLEQYGDCTACREKKKDEELHNAELEASEEGWAALTGSEKQIRWAVMVRKDLLDKLRKYTAAIPDTDHMKSEMFRFFGSKTSARFWIDQRDLISRDLIRLFGEECRKKNQP